MSEKPVEVEGEPPYGESFGTWLRQQREMREIHLNEIADRTKISLRYLRAMEQDNFELLPGHVFVKGFLREYAKYVGLNPDEVVNFYLSTQAEPEEAGGETLEDASPPPRLWGRGLVVAILAILLLAVLSYLVFVYLSGEQGQAMDDPPPFIPSEPPVVVGQSPPPAAGSVGAAPSETEILEPGAEPGAPLEVTLDFSEDCWVEVLVDDGARRVDRRFVQGESLTLPAQQSVEILTLGNAGGVSLQVNGIPFPLEASSGQVERNVRIDLETLRGLGGAAPSESKQAGLGDE